jgi:hypothetical protein
MVKITVWFDENYTTSATFSLPEEWTINEITDEVNRRYEEWYSFDIW